MSVSNELKTGVAVVISVAVLCFALFKTGDLDVTKQGYVIQTQFKDIDGVKKFAPVRLAGVEVGEVTDIRIEYRKEETVIIAELWIDSEVKVRTDVEAFVATVGLMGEKYIELKTGTSESFVSAGDEVSSREPVKMDDLLRKAEGVMEEANGALKEVKEAAKSAKEIMKDAQPKLRSILTNLDGVLAVNRPKIDRILSNLQDTSEFFKEFSEDIKYHPWKVLMKGKEKTEEELAELRLERLKKKAKEQGLVLVDEGSGQPDETDEEPSKTEKNRGFLFG